jgi:hypothetical protein
MITIKSRPGLKIRHPLTHLHLPDSGLEVSEFDTYWVRALADGDVVLADPGPIVVEPDQITDSKGA